MGIEWDILLIQVVQLKFPKNKEKIKKKNKKIKKKKKNKNLNQVRRKKTMILWYEEKSKTINSRSFGIFVEINKNFQPFFFKEKRREYL